MSIEFAKQECTRYKKIITEMVNLDLPPWFDPIFHFENIFQPYIEWWNGNRNLKIYFGDDMAAYEFNFPEFPLDNSGLMNIYDCFKFTVFWMYLNK